MMDALPLIVWYLDDPVADPALVPLWFVAREARKHVKVVLSGEGADELFGGYTIYREPLSLRAVRAGARRAARAARARCPPGCPEGMRGKDLLRRGAIPLEQRYYGNARIFRDEQLAGRAAPVRPAPLAHRRHRGALRASRRAGTRWPGCSTSTCSPGCAATSWSRPTR